MPPVNNTRMTDLDLPRSACRVAEVPGPRATPAARSRANCLRQPEGTRGAGAGDVSSWQVTIMAGGGMS